MAKGNDLQARRQLQEFFGKRDVANVLVDRIAPINADRDSGYTTLSVVGVRAGDNSHMVEIKWVTMPERVGSLKNPNPAPKNERKTKRSTTIKSSKSSAPKLVATKKAAVKTPATAKKVTEKPKSKTKKTTTKK
jgi:hypothetical protein